MSHSPSCRTDGALFKVFLLLFPMDVKACEGRVGSCDFVQVETHLRSLFENDVKSVDCLLTKAKN